MVPILDDKILRELKEYIDYHLEGESAERSILCDMMAALPEEMEDYINTKRKPTLNQVLFLFIDKKGATDSDIYKKAGIDRRHFSKIRSNSNYRAGKNTVIALALALELDTEDTAELLSSAGYSLSDSDTYDLVIQFCLGKKIYDIDQVNQALEYFSLKPLW